MTTTADWYLKQWGRYIRVNRSEFLGYPRRNVIHKMIYEGPGASQSTAPVEYAPPIEVEIIDRIVPKLPSDMQDILFLAFVHQVSVREGGKIMQCNKSKYSESVKMAVNRVEGNLDFLLEKTA